MGASSPDKSVNAGEQLPAGPGFFTWLLALAANGLFAVFWSVFGAAAAGNANASAHRFIVISIVTAALPLIGSIALAIRGRFGGAVGVAWATVPALFAGVLFW